MILEAFRRSDQTRNIHALYGAIVAQARSPVFFTGYGIPDTVSGRFELIVLHLVLVLRRLKREDDRPFSQRLFDLFCHDLDDNLREMGVGDLAVPRQMRHFGEAFYGRQAAYGAALAGADDRALEKALARNIFESSGTDDRATRLARYVRAVAGKLDGERPDFLMSGMAVFPDPEAFTNA